MLFSKRLLVFGIIVCALLHGLSIHHRTLRPAQPKVPVTTEGSFQPDGAYPGEPFAHADTVRAWGSWSGSDDNTGTITIGPFPAPRVLHVGLGGYPDHPGNGVRVELAGTKTQLAIESGPVGERWRVMNFELPESWGGRPIRIIATDAGKGIGGWLAISEPVRGGHGDGNNALIETLAAWAINGLWLGVLFAASVRLLATRSRVTAAWIPLAAGAVVAASGYAMFWAYFANPLVGRIASWTALVAALAWLWQTRRVALPIAVTLEVTSVVKLMFVIGAFYLGLLHLFPTSHDFYTLARNRFRDAMPADNLLPHILAERLFANRPIRLGEEWLSSDRPPLQTGWELLTWPAAKVLQLERGVASGTSAVWFQLLWVAGAYGLLRAFGVMRPRATGWVATLALSGFFLQNTVYTWPKLSAGAFACGAFALLVRPASDSPPRSNARWAAFLAALGWLSHGGVAFSYLALLPWVIGAAWRGAWRHWRSAAVIFVVLTAPWFAYQKWYDPPGNLLLKWHLGGQIARDPRGTWETIRDSYAKIGWREAWANKVANFHGQIFGEWKHLMMFSPETAPERRNQEFFQPGRALTWWPLLAVLALVLARRGPRPPARDLLPLLGWLVLTVVIWCLLMFQPYSAVVHQGSYAMMLGMFVLCSVVLERFGRGWLAVLVVLQAITLATTWAVANPVIHGPATGLPLVLLAAAGLGWFIVAAFRVRDSEAGSHAVALERSPCWVEAWRAWWQDPRPTLGALIILGCVMFLRRPDALLTPQLWAEDGSVFLNHQDAYGFLRAFFMPYAGYLHALPRIIAAIATWTADPRWWPAIYNGAAFVIWLATIARLFSPRLDLPYKPWLALALLLVPHSGEIFYNVTNLQWITAFVLIQQALIAPPRTTGQRVSDLIILGLVSLTGPFAIVFLPLFAWRLWRERTRDNVLVLVALGLCAVTQAWLVVRTGPTFPFQGAPLHLWPNFIVLVRRIIVWPVLGHDLNDALTPRELGLIGVVFFGGVFAWIFRPHPRRIVRAQIFAAFVLIVIAGIYRARPDTWVADNPDFADRYFYIPRVLFVWLLVSEFDAAPRLVANLARLFFLAMVALHIWSYIMPAPADYHWADHVEPIRRGVRADIPTLPEGWTLEYAGRPQR